MAETAPAAAGVPQQEGLAVPPTEAILFPIVCIAVGLACKSLTWTKVPYTALLLVRSNSPWPALLCQAARAGFVDASHATQIGGCMRRCSTSCRMTMHVLAACHAAGGPCSGLPAARTALHSGLHGYAGAVAGALLGLHAVMQHAAGALQAPARRATLHQCFSTALHQGSRDPRAVHHTVAGQVATAAVTAAAGESCTSFAAQCVLAEDSMRARRALHLTTLNPSLQS